MRFVLFCFFISFFVTAGMADAQVLPQKSTGSILINDSSDDKMYRLTDFNLDGDFNDVDEIIDFYDGTSSALYLGNPTCVTVDHRGFVYVVDSSSEFVIRLIDLNGDGDANEPNEAAIWLDNTNQSGVVLASPNTIVFNPDGTAYVSNAGDGGADADNILFCDDKNGDFDVNDAGEVVLFYDPLGAAPDISMDLPQGLALDGNGILYCVNPNKDGGYVVRLEDLNSDGNANGMGETTYYYDASGGGPAFTFGWTINFMHDGGLLISDTVTDIIILGHDLNANGSIDDAGETDIYRAKIDPGVVRPSSAWGIETAGFNVPFWDVYCADSGSPDSVIGLKDKNADGDAREADECEEVYDENSGAVNITNPRANGFITGPYVERIGVPVQGATLEFVMTATTNDNYALFLSASISSGITLPPYGVADLLPPFILLVQGTLPLDAQVSVPVKIPANSPGLVGFKFYVQGISGTAYHSVLSNTVESTIQ